jgi:hypothetical protein
VAFLANLRGCMGRRRRCGQPSGGHHGTDTGNGEKPKPGEHAHGTTGSGADAPAGLGAGPPIVIALA